MAKGSTDPHRQSAVACAREIIDGRRSTLEGARHLATELLPTVEGPQAEGFAALFAEAVGEWRDEPATRARVDERIRHIAWRVVVAWR
jgi:hypothetical protein